MATLLVRHTVSDYAAWRKAYDAFRPIQKAKAVKAEAVYQAADNPTDVTVPINLPREGSPSVRCERRTQKAMQSAGVGGAQRFGSRTEPECRQVRALLTRMLAVPALLVLRPIRAIARFSRGGNYAVNAIVAVHNPITRTTTNRRGRTARSRYPCRRRPHALPEPTAARCPSAAPPRR